MVAPVAQVDRATDSLSKSINFSNCLILYLVPHKVLEILSKIPFYLV